MSKIRVAVLYGGMSSERDVSLVSGAACADALTAEGYDVTRIDVAPNLWDQLHEADPDVVFNALHGDWGEDGRVQGVLDMFGAPYTHSGVMASALAMDKHRSKAVLRDVGINVPDGILVSRVEAAKHHAMEPPYVLKPNGQGSSKSVYIVREGDSPPADMAGDDGMGEFVICERFVPGRELTVSVMNGEAWDVTEIVPKNAFYDYDAKYSEGGSAHILPADISNDIRDICLTWAALAHNALGCRGISRADFIFSDINDDLTDDVKKVVMLEVNTQPGMTPTSLVPEQALRRGISFSRLCRRIVEDASWPR